VQLPYPLFSPTIMLQQQVVDVCASVTLDASDTSGTGGWALFTWELLSVEADSTAGQSAPEQEIEKLRAILTASNGKDNSQVIIESDDMPAGFTYEIRLTVVSRWMMTAQATAMIKKLSYPAPKITIAQ
jgi:hypothetical protein